MPRFDRDLTDPTPDAVEKTLVEAVEAANQRCTKGLLKVDRADYRAFLASEFVAPSGVGLWLAEKGRVLEFPPTPRATLLGLAWSTTPVGKKVVRVVGRRIEPFNEHPGNRFGPPWRCWPALCLLDPDHVVIRTWAGGEPETIALCNCGAVGPPEKLGWMLGRCGPCHDHQEEHGAPLAGSPTALRTEGQLSTLGFTPSGRSVAAMEWRGLGRSVSRQVVVWDRQTATQETKEGSADDYDKAAPKDPATGLFLPGAYTLSWIKEGRRRLSVSRPSGTVDYAFHGSTLAAMEYTGATWRRDWKPGAVWEQVWPERRGGLDLIYFSLALTPDGARAALGRSEGAVELLDWHGGGAGVTLQRPAQAENWQEQRVYDLAFSPNGKLLAAAMGLSGFVDDPSENWFGRGGGLDVYDVAKGACVMAVPTPRDDILAVAFSPDGALLFAGSTDCTIRVFDVAAGKELAVLSGHMGGVNALAFSPDGQTLASAGGDGLVRLWPWRTLLERPAAKKRRT